MNLYGEPVLKLRTKDRLHITKEPGIMSWAVVMVTFSALAFGPTYYLLSDYFLLSTVFITVCLLFSLNLIQMWDFILDKEENLVTYITRSWYHGFSMTIPKENVKRFPLSSVGSVFVNAGTGINIKKKDGSCMTIKVEGQSYRSLVRLKREITTFLYLERIEYLRGKDKIFYSWDIDPWSMNWMENDDPDEEVQQSSNSGQEETYEFGRNVKVITGPL